MMWKIITDSSCDIKEFNKKDGELEIEVLSVPFFVSVGDKAYLDDGTVDIDEMILGMKEAEAVTSTACPSPAAWIEKAGDAENLIFITISKELSGSYNSANIAVSDIVEEDDNRNAAVINSRSAGPGLGLIVEKICESIAEGKAFDEVVAEANEVAGKMNTLFGLSSFHNLVKNGRMSMIAGLIAGKLHFWGIGMASPEGSIIFRGKVRGHKMAVSSMVQTVSEEANLSAIKISHCKNIEMATEIKEKLEEAFENIKIEIDETKALCSYYAEEHGLIISYY